MNKYQQIVNLLNKNKGKYVPADPRKMNEYQLLLGVPVDKEYIEFQTTCGLISIGAFECFGLAMPDNYYLSTINRIRTLRELTKHQFPSNLIPLYNLDEHVDVCWHVLDKKIHHYNVINNQSVSTGGTLFDEIYRQVLKNVK